MMGTEEVEAVGARKTTLTPKAIIHQKFGDKASYKIEEVHESTPTGCPGLTIPQKGPCLYRCSLQLPEISVVSGTFKKKKDAEQCAAEMALEKLGLHLTVTDSTPQDPWEILVSRIRYLFSDEFPSFLHPLSGHFRATFGSKGDACGLVPVSVIAVYDAKLHSLCKSIDSEVELNPLLIILFIMRATSRLSEFLVTSKEHLWIRRQNPYPPEIIESSRSELCGSPKSVQIEAIFLPCSLEKSVGAMTLHVSSNEYFLDVIAKKLGLEDAHDVLVSRNVGKASSETRVFFAAPKSYLLHPSDLLNAKEALHFDEPLNVRASYLSGQDIFGDAILASIAYTWKSKDLFHEDVTIQSYYRCNQKSIAVLYNCSSSSFANRL
ncbi:Small RNA 2-O-methyltransferase [Quillaja saponaria]|uniref:Small RNA 2-O-methyltransferase n=1 Tax=Quillaja saponaria TaxID=32244 RepID=A0AAD7PVP8_QUISA|nr:Small RNA 2-O-methyltransferase [Quillaja saponaria]